MGLKTCIKCQVEKDLDDFNKMARSPDGHATICRVCDSAYKSAWKKRRYRADAEFRQRENAKASQWKRDNKELHALFNRSYGRRHAKALTAQYLEKRRTNPGFRIITNLRSRLQELLGGSKSRTTLELIGCNYEQLRLHLEKQFKPGMTWENYGVYTFGGPRTWHVDHRTPCAAFDLTKEENQIKCFHYTNLQPLWADENVRKGNRVMPQTRYFALMPSSA